MGKTTSATDRYAEYLRSDQWQSLRRAAISRDGFKCRACHKQTGLQVHHLRYPSSFKDDCLDTLITLCRVHHANRHGQPLYARHISIPIDSIMRRIESVVAE
jgi:5-methylcytosine-specific restriction endonuclease McrA